MKITKLSRNAGRLLALASLSLFPVVNAATIFDRSPTGVNETGYQNQTNMDGTFLVGDDADLSLTPNSSGEWLIDSVTVWDVANGTTDPAANPMNEFASLTLMFGNDALGTLSPVSSTYTATYAPQSGFTHAVYAVTFSGLNLVVPSTADVGFAVNAVAADMTSNTFAILTAAGGPDADGFYLNYFVDGSNADFDGGTAVDADVSVLITGSEVPEPATFGLMGLGLLGAMFVGRRRKA
jgi:hypothetical protein